MAGLPVAMRIPRTPSAGLASSGLLANFSGENDIAQCAAPLLKPMKRMQLELDQCTQVLKESAEEVAALQATLGVA